MEFTNFDQFWGMDYLELAGFISGIGGVWLTARHNVWCFPVGLINVLISIWLFYCQNLYADVLQQAVYIVLLIYGWFKWFNNTSSFESTGISRLSTKGIISLSIIMTFFALLLGALLGNYTQASYPRLDSLATSMAFTAQFLVARKKIENWLLWIPVNLIYISIYFLKDLPLYAILSAVYLLLAIIGYSKWLKTMKLQNSTV